MSIRGCIIAGGKSGRFGSDKSLHVFNGKPLIRHVYDAVHPVIDKIFISANDPEKFAFMGLEVVPDLIPNLGPLGGIYTALETSGPNRIFALPCDMPYLNSSLISFMCSIEHDYDIIVPRIEDKYQPLHAIYSHRCAKAIRRSIEEKNYKMTGFYKGMNLRIITEDEVRRFGNPEIIFKNINFREDIE
jgi:molybdopterin-guanine dinucleotide biosynthesis protein A